MRDGAGGAAETKAQRVERIKREKDGLDVWDDLLRGASADPPALADEDYERLKWYGLYRSKPEGHLMARLRLPNGAIEAHQIAVVAELAERFAHGYADLTTRQNFQLHWLQLGDLPYLLGRLHAAGLTTTNAAGDGPRNIVGCPVAGVDPRAVVDARPVVDEVGRLFLANRSFSNLPRKLKISISGCCRRCALPEINDLGLSGVLRERRGGPERGYDLQVGGGLSSQPRLARRLPVFLLPHQVRPVCAAVAELFREHGCREDRGHARLKFLLDEWGVERFTAELQQRLPFRLDPDVPSLPELPDQRDHLGVNPQTETGLHSVGLAVRLGRLSSVQLAELARLAAGHGSGAVRLTPGQHLVVLDVPTAAVDPLLEAAAQIDLAAEPSPWRRGMVACTGAQFCAHALVPTKAEPGEAGFADQLLDLLEERLPAFDQPVRIHLNGCPNSCGQHWLGEVGLQGALVKVADGESQPGAMVTLGGGLGSNGTREPAFGRRTGVRLPLHELPEALVRLFTAYQARRQDSETVRDFLLRLPDAEAKALLAGV